MQHEFSPAQLADLLAKEEEYKQIAAQLSQLGLGDPPEDVGQPVLSGDQINEQFKQICQSSPYLTEEVSG